MSEPSLGPDDWVLLKLMEKYKPHLKPYAYRQDTWLRVLDDYNEQTGSLYRQTRTLKAKFNKLKALSSDENNGKIAVGDLELLQKLVGETDNATVHRASRKRRNRTAAVENGLRRATGEGSRDAETYSGEANAAEYLDEAASQTEETSDGTQPPPLDSITMGFSSRNAASSSLGLTPEGASVKPVKQTSVEPVGDLKPLNTSRQNYEAQIYKHLTSNLLEILSRKACAPESVLDPELITVDRLYSEFKDSQRAEQQFREDVLHRLDTIIKSLGNRAYVPD